MCSVQCKTHAVRNGYDKSLIVMLHNKKVKLRILRIGHPKNQQYSAQMCSVTPLTLLNSVLASISEPAIIV